jgi:hypothetical protein
MTTTVEEEAGPLLFMGDLEAALQQATPQQMQRTMGRITSRMKPPTAMPMMAPTGNSGREGGADLGGEAP